VPDGQNPLFPEWDQAAREESTRRRDAAMHRVDEHAPTTWKECAESAIRWVAERREEMTTDPVWYVLDSWSVPFPPEPRALGPLMKSACKWGWLEQTGRVHKSVRPECHRRPLAVYKSKVYDARIAI
jgi:hypothetical protein